MGEITVSMGFGLAPPASDESQAVTSEAESAAEIAGLVHAYSGLLFRVAFSILRSSPDAEDVVQDAFVRVLERRPQLAGIRDTRVWLVRIAWNLALDRRRRIRPDQMDDRFARVLAAVDLPADQALAASAHTASVLREIDRLPAKEREALTLSAMEELETAEIARIVKRSESATRALLFRARTRLRQRLEKGVRR